MPNGKITREEIATQELINWGLEYAKNVGIAEQANKDLIKSANGLASISRNFSLAKTQREYVKTLNEQNKALTIVSKSEIQRNKSLQEIQKTEAQRNKTLQEGSKLQIQQRKAIQEAIKIEAEKNKVLQQGFKTEAERSKAIAHSSKIIAERLRNEKLALDVQAKKERAQRSNTKLTIEERVANQALNKIKRQQARLQLGLVDTYEKLSQQRNKAQRDLQNLLAGNKANTAEITRAERRYASLNARLLKVDKATDNFTRNIGNYSSALGGLRGTLTSLSSALGLVGGAFAFVQVLRNGVDVIRTFDKSSATLSGVLQLQRSETVALTQDAVRLGETTVKTSGQVTELQIAYARLGFSQKEILDLTEPTINGSIALNAELDRTAKLTGAVVNTFDDLATSDAPKILDILSLATAKSALEFSDLETGIPIVAGAANAAGVPFTKLIALQGKLADSGIDVSTSSTALRNIFIESADQGLNFGQILDKIANSQDKLTASNDEFGKRASVSATVLAANIKATDTLDEALQNAAGTAQSMADKELDTLDGAIKLLSSAWEGYILNTNEANSVGNSLKDGIQFLAENLKEILNGVVFLTKAYVTYVAVSKLATFQQRLLSTSVAKTSIQQRIAQINTVRQARGLTLLSASSLRASASVRLLGNALKANAIGIGIAVIFGLVKAFQALNQSALENAKNINQSSKTFVDNSREALKQSETIKSLADRYDVLTEKEKLNSAEQVELTKIIKTLSDEFPNAVSGVNSLTNSFDINTEKVRSLQEGLGKLTVQGAKTQIDELTTSLDSLNNRQENIDRFFNGGDLFINGSVFKQVGDEVRVLNKIVGANGQVFTNYNKVTFEQNKIIQDFIKGTQEAVKNTKDQINANEDLISSITGELNERQILQKVKDIENEADKNAEEARLKAIKDKAEADKKAIEDKAKADKKAIEENESLRKSAFELLKFRQQEKIRLSKQVADNDQESVDARVMALTEISIAEIELARLEKNNAIANAKNQNEKQLAIEKFKSIKVESERNASEQTLKILEAESKRVEDLQKKSLADRVKDQLNFIKQISDIDKTDENTEIARVNTEVQDTEERERQIAEIKSRYAKQALNDQLEVLKSLVKTEGLTADQRIALEKKISEIKLGISQVDFANQEENLEKTKVNLQEVLQEISGFASSINGLMSAFGSRRISQIDAEIERNEEFFANQLELVGEDDRRREAIEQRQERKRLQLEAKRRREQVKQAKTEKAFALSQIAINTAIAVTTVTGQTGILAPLIIPLIIATGALQAATVLAQPIPQFEKGTQGTPHKGGFAEVAEKRPEVIIEPNKKPYIVAKNQILDLPKGTEVIPSVEEFKKSQRRQVMNRLTEKNDHNMRVFNENTYNSSFSDKAIVDELRANRKELSKKQPIIINNMVKESFKRGNWNG